MGWIILLVVVGVILYVVELVLLPGITIAAIGSFLALIAGVAWAYVDYGAVTGTIVLLIALVCVIIITALFLRPKTWSKVALKTKIKEAVDDSIESQVALNSEGVTLTRLAPMGKVQIGGNIYEAKSLDSYIDPQSDIVVTGYENFSLIVKLR